MRRAEPPFQEAQTPLTLKDVVLTCQNCNQFAVGEAALLAPIQERYIGRRITVAQAFEILTEIERVYREAGYYFVNALMDPQDVDPDAAVLEITVIEPRLGEIKVLPEEDPALNPVREALERIAAPYRQGQALRGRAPRLTDIERLLLLLNDVPGVVSAAATPRRGAAPGVMDLFINVEFDRLSGVVFADRKQSPALGPGLAGVSVEAASILLPGDVTTLSLFNTVGLQAVEFTERNTVQLEYVAPVGAYGTTVGARALYSRSQPGDILAPLDLQGEQKQAAVFVRHPVIRTRAFSLWGEAGFNFDENGTDFGAGGAGLVDDRLRSVSLSADALYRPQTPPPGIDFLDVKGEIELRQGLDILDASRPGDPALSRFDGEPDFTLIRGGFTAEAYPDIGHELLQGRLSLFAAGSAQISRTPLLSNEEFSIGGPGTVRGFDPAEFTGDHGFSLTGEVRHRTVWGSFESPLNPGVSQEFSTQVYGFADYGAIFSAGDGLPRSERLFSYGGGLRFTFGDSTNLNLEVAQPGQPLARDNSENPKFSVSFVYRF